METERAKQVITAVTRHLEHSHGLKVKFLDLDGVSPTRGSVPVTGRRPCALHAAQHGQRQAAHSLQLPHADTTEATVTPPQGQSSNRDATPEQPPLSKTFELNNKNTTHNKFQ